MSVSLRCPQGTVLPTLPPRVLQGTAVSGERISQGPPGNVVAFGMPAPSEEGFRAVSSDASCRFAVSGCRSDCTTTYKSRNQSPEAGTSSSILTVWKLLPNISHWVLQTIEKGYQYSSGLARPGLWGCFHRGGPQQVLVMEQEVKALLEKGP